MSNRVSLKITRLGRGWNLVSRWGSLQRSPRPLSWI